MSALAGPSSRSRSSSSTPKVSASVGAGARALLGKLSISGSSSDSTPLLPFIPKPVKILLLALLVLHSPSWPFVWHIRVWYHALKAYYLAYRKGHSRYFAEWKASNDKQGGVRGLRSRQKRVAFFDDCDYNLHLSNSAYAKNSDAMKMDYCIASMSPVFTPGAHMALGATHYNFFKEIPIGVEYTMEARTVGWDDKWLYIAIEFIIYPKKGKGKGKDKSKSQSKVTDLKDKAQAATAHLAEKVKEAEAESSRPPVFLSISDPPTRSTSPSPAPSSAGGLNVPSASSSGWSQSGSSTPTAGGSKAEEIRRAWAKRRADQPRADGGVVCCLSVSEYCFKMGRVTIPPRIALWFALQSPSKAEQDRALSLLRSKDWGRSWLKGGWRDEADADSLGRDIGVGEDGVDWAGQGREAMDMVVQGISAF